VTVDRHVGTKCFAGSPPRIAAYTTAAPWMPPEAATTPADGMVRVRRLAKAPRVLNEPACWSSSSLSVSGKATSPRSAPVAARVGVSRTWGRMIACVFSVAARSMGTVAGPMIGDVDTQLAIWQSGEDAFRGRRQGPGQREAA